MGHQSLKERVLHSLVQAPPLSPLPIPFKLCHHYLEKFLALDVEVTIMMEKEVV